MTSPKRAPGNCARRAKPVTARTRPVGVTDETSSRAFLSLLRSTPRAYTSFARGRELALVECIVTAAFLRNAGRRARATLGSAVFARGACTSNAFGSGATSGLMLLRAGSHHDARISWYAASGEAGMRRFGVYGMNSRLS